MAILYAVIDSVNRIKSKILKKAQSTIMIIYILKDWDETVKAVLFILFNHGPIIRHS